MNSLVSNVENLFGTSMFMQLCASVIVICMTGFVLMADDHTNFVETISNLIYFCALLFQTSLFCFAGNELIYAVIFKI